MLFYSNINRIIPLSWTSIFFIELFVDRIFKLVLRKGWVKFSVVVFLVNKKLKVKLMWKVDVNCLWSTSKHIYFISQAVLFNWCIIYRLCATSATSALNVSGLGMAMGRIWIGSKWTRIQIRFLKEGSDSNPNPRV